MNGQPLTAAHGFPLRVVAPGWAGDSWVKWLQRIEVIDYEFPGFWMKTAYRHPIRPVAPGATVDAKDLVPVTISTSSPSLPGPGNGRSRVRSPSRALPGPTPRRSRKSIFQMTWVKPGRLQRLPAKAQSTDFASGALSGAPLKGNIS